MREKIIEQKFRVAVRAAGGVAVKFVSPGLDGMPDRLALLPGGRMAFVEVKAPGKKPRPLQEARHRMLRRLGFKVYVLDDENRSEGSLMKYRPHEYQRYATEYIETHPMRRCFCRWGLARRALP